MFGLMFDLFVIIDECIGLVECCSLILTYIHMYIERGRDIIRICVHVCMYIYIYIYTYIHKYIYIYIYTYMCHMIIMFARADLF